jgi:MFS family permease
LTGQYGAKENGSIRSLIKGNVLVLTVSRVIWSMSMSIVFPFLSLYIIDLGGTKPLVGMVNALGSVAGMLLFPLGGYLADKAGRAKFVGIATFLFASSFLLFIFAPTWQWLAVGVVYQQIVLFYMPALNAIMADSIPVGARGRILSLTIAIPEAVRILIPYVGAWLIATYTLQPAMRIAYTFSLLTGAFVGVLRYRYLEETIENSKIDRNIPRVLKESFVDVFKSMSWVLSNLRGYAIIAILITLVASIVQPFWIIYASEVIGLTVYEWGLVLLGGGFVKTVLSFIIGGLVDRVGPKRCILISLAVTVPGVFLFTRSTGFISTAAIYIFLVVGNAFLWIASSVLLADTIPRDIRGRVMAAMGQGLGVGISGGGYSRGFLLFIPATIGSFLGGYIYDFNPAMPWFIQSAFLMLGIALTVLLVKEPEKAEV